MQRAKNSVTVFDDNPTARAPFYYFLARLGLGKLVLTSLMEVGCYDLPHSDFWNDCC